MDAKKKLDKLSGSQSNSFRIIYRSPYDATRFILEFTLEIDEATYKKYQDGDEVLYIKFNVKNRKIGGIKDDDEFEFYFNKPVFSENLTESIYDIYKISFFGVNESDLIWEYNFS